MFEQRNLKLDLLALALVALTVFLAASLFSYDRADPPSQLVYPQNVEIHNVCGRSGAIASRVLFEAMGAGAYYLVVSLVVLDTVLLTRRKVNQPWLRAAGWLLSLVGVSVLAAVACPQLSPGPVIGAGGYLGTAGRGLLQLHFARLGTYIITLSVLVGGLLLCTDYVLFRLAAWILRRPTQTLGRGVLQVGAAYAQKVNNRRRSDLDGYVSRKGDAQVPVKISGRGNEEKAAEPADSKKGKNADRPENAAADPKVEKKANAAPQELSVVKPAAKKPPPDNHEEMIEELEAAGGGPQDDDYELPSLDLLLQSEPFCYEEQEKEVLERAKILEKTFLSFGFNVRVVEIQTGPVIAQFEVELESGLRLSKITALADDLAIALRVPSVRIVAPIPGKNTVGIEVPNTDRQVVRMREVMEEANGKAAKMRIPLYLGKDVAGNPLVVDLTTLPHLLIAGRTGTGKSVCLNSMIVSMVMTRRPDEVRMLMIDPKMVELSGYKALPHLMHPVVTDMRKAEAILGWAVEKMEERYHLLARAGVRHISVYNQLGEEELMERIQPENDEERKLIPTQMPFIVIVADELADLMMTSAKEVESHIIRLAQKSRAVGIHLVLATQKPTVDVITGLIKSNLPARISFQVASRTDSRVVLDEMGADKLLGNGDLLFLWPGTSTLIRGQGTYLSDDEISKVIAAVATDEPQFVKELVQLKAAAPEGEKKDLSSRDELYEAAVDVVIREGRGSVSLLQRSLGIGYGRAARLIDFMAEDGIVGEYNGSQAREVIISLQRWEEMCDRAEPISEPSAFSAPAKPRRTNKIKIAPPSEESPEDEEESPPYRKLKSHVIKPDLNDEPPFDVEEDEDESAEQEQIDAWDNEDSADDQYIEDDESEEAEYEEEVEERKGEEHSLAEEAPNDSLPKDPPRRKAESA
ncbi:MAG: DNA translocase FtsK [Pirellulales bacterium]|nr:DNA translocase FtsK [Pirellulales bacterium]